MTITRQDLEGAAKAAGYFNFIAIYGWTDDGSIALDANDPQETWNPITSKADLWDLAAACGMYIDFFGG